MKKEKEAAAGMFGDVFHFQRLIRIVSSVRATVVRMYFILS